MSTLTVPDGEDSVSFERHNRALKLEHDKVHPNKQVVEELMTQSFAMRWNDLHTNSYGLDTVFEKYPFLSDVSEVSLYIHVQVYVLYGVCTFFCRLFKTWNELLVTMTCASLRKLDSETLCPRSLSRHL